MARLRLARERVDLGSLPDWPFWRFINTPTEEKDSQIWLDEDQGNLSIGYRKWIAVCTVKNSNQWIHQTHDNAKIDSKPIIIEPDRVNLPEIGNNVDMNPEVDDDYLEVMREQVLFGDLSIYSFVRRALCRARTSWDRESYAQELVWMLKAPIELDEFWENPQDEHIEARLYDWMSIHPGLEAKRLLVRQDTQLQIVLMLELESIVKLEALPPEAEGLIYEHFARLCIWQALDYGETDHVWDFVTQVILPNYKSLARDTCESLFSKARGVAYASQKPQKPARRLRRSKISNHLEQSNALVDALVANQNKEDSKRARIRNSMEKAKAPISNSRASEPTTPKKAKHERTVHDPISPSPRKRSMIRLSFPSWTPSTESIQLNDETKKRRVSQRHRIEPEKLAREKSQPAARQRQEAESNKQHLQVDQDEAIGSDTEDASHPATPTHVSTVRDAQ